MIDRTRKDLALHDKENHKLVCYKNPTTIYCIFQSVAIVVFKIPKVSYFQSIFLLYIFHTPKYKVHYNAINIIVNNI